MAKSMAFADHTPDSIDMESASHLRRILASIVEGGSTSNVLTLVEPNGETANVVLTHAIAETFLSVLRLVQSGQGFHLVPYDAELSTQQAADLLNVSRPHFVKLLDANEVTHSKVGRHRRVKAKDLFEYMKERDEKRSNILDELAKDDVELGLI